MKPAVLILSLLVGTGTLATGIVVSQTSSYDPMSSFIEYSEDTRTPLQSVQKINELIKKVKDAFQKLKEKIDNYEQGFKDYKAILKDGEEEKEKMGDPRVRELARINFLVKNLESLLEKEELLSGKKERLKGQETSLEEKIKEIERKGKDYSNSENGRINDISKLAGDFFEKIQELYEELFLFFEQYGGLISKNIGINRKKSLSALLSLAEKVGLLEAQQNTDYMNSGLIFTKTITTSDEQLMEEINKDNNFIVNEQNSTLTLKTMDKNIWTFFDWNKDGKNDLSDWKGWITKS